MLLDASSEDVFSSSGGAGSSVKGIVPLDEDGYLEPQSTSNSGGYLVVMQGLMTTLLACFKLMYVSFHVLCCFANIDYYVIGTM